MGSPAGGWTETFCGIRVLPAEAGLNKDNQVRARNLKPGFFKNEDLASVPPYARLLFAGLWTLCDREGRLEDRPARIKAEIFPYDDLTVSQVNGMLSELQEKGFVLRYGGKYIAVVNFLKHQNPHVKESASTIPAPDKHSASTAFSGTSPASSLNPSSLNPESLTPSHLNLEKVRAPQRPVLRELVVAPKRAAEFAAQYPDQSNQNAAVQQYLSVVKSADEEMAVFECLARYKASDAVARGVIMSPAKWLTEQSDNGWKGQWAGPRSPPKKPGELSFEQQVAFTKYIGRVTNEL